ncbi:hypothetical protein BX070DRAFT_107563 [Coemansia spiralis]|nr:hypothetical protein BX070DRAFT_107563 [Coemansia spiralis]
MPVLHGIQLKFSFVVTRLKLQGKHNVDTCRYIIKQYASALNTLVASCLSLLSIAWDLLFDDSNTVITYPRLKKLKLEFSMFSMSIQYIMIGKGVVVFGFKRNYLGRPVFLLIIYCSEAISTSLNIWKWV